MFHANSLPSPHSSPPSVNPPLFVPFLHSSRFSTMSRFPTVSFNLYPRRRFLFPFSLLRVVRVFFDPVFDQNPGEFSSSSQKSLSPFSTYRTVFLFKDFPPFLDVPPPPLLAVISFFPVVSSSLSTSFFLLALPSRYFFSFLSDCGNSRTRDVYTQLLTRIQDSRYKMPCHTPHHTYTHSTTLLRCSYTVIQNFESLSLCAPVCVHMCAGEEFENSVSFPSSTRAKICSPHFAPSLSSLFSRAHAKSRGEK